ncbi:MAG TPA: protein kinase [Nocardioides sp.]|uniref:serine/threonine protein kinase n=1 Tax=Nocardioides sp. TaxID=35761 RepID=UPI002D809C0E|nr:protein kinase [Nocardioides sp.]HET6652602.1 protein kinase [Nocardioides sp.]
MTEPTVDPRYRLESRIATGGMGVVWRATDTVLAREVAVKILKPEYADDPSFRSRFESEARHAAALHHPGVASVFDFGELPDDDGSGRPRPYLVMELVPGQPLSALLRGGEPMPPETATDLCAQAADALAAAHRLGIVHRDIKPANLLVTPDRRVKITDFGIARAADAAGITQTGQVVGTPAYISPEQAEGKTSTAASDVYALGVVLYECLAGARPFRGDSPIATALAHLRDEPPPLPDSVPEHLRDIVAVALAKDPAARFESMDAFAAALRGAPVRAGVGRTAVGAGAAVGAAAAAADPDDGSTRVLAAAPTDDEPTAATPARATSGRPAWLPWAGAALAVLVLVLLIAWLGRGDEGGDPSPGGNDGTASESAQPRETPTQESPTPEEPTSEAPSPEEPAGVEVVAEDYIGMHKDEAKARLEALGLKVKEQKVENDGSVEQDTVTDVVPVGTLQEGDRVTIFVADKPPAEPPPAPSEEPTGETDVPPGQGGEPPGQSNGKQD